VQRDRSKCNVGEYYLSNIFDLCGFQWILMIYPNGKNKGKNTAINLRLLAQPNLSDVIFQIKAQYTICMDSKIWSRERTFNASGKGWGTKNFCSIEEFKRCETPDGGHYFTISVKIEDIQQFESREDQLIWNSQHQIEE
jgi:hypothetical protein